MLYVCLSMNMNAYDVDAHTYFPGAAIHHMNEAIPALSMVESRRAQDCIVEKRGFGVCVYIYYDMYESSIRIEGV